MNSWRLFTFALVFWEAYENPIFLREAAHEPAWYKVAQRIGRIPSLSLAIVAGSFLLWFAVLLFFRNILVFLLLPLFLHIIATGITLAPLVVDERVKHSWETLLVAPFTPMELLLGKVSGALWWLRHMLLAMSVLLFLVAIGIGFISLALTPTSLPGTDEVPIFVLCLGVAVLPVVGATAFVIDRIQQFLLVVSAVVAAGSSATSLRTAFFSAISVSMIVWIVEILFAGMILTFQPGRTTMIAETNLLSLITLGPVVNFIITFNLAQTVFWTCCTFVGREIAIRCLWRWAEHRVRIF